MRTRLLFLFLSLFVSSNFAQWVTQTSGSTDRIRIIDPVSATVVWAAGNAGKVYRTTDGGTTWTNTVTLSTAINYGLEAIDANTAWVTGTVGGSADVSIWKTTNAGATWVSQYNNPTSFGDGIKFFNANDGVYYGDPDPYPSTNWELLTTTNGGTTWTRVPRANFPGADSANGEYGAAGSMAIAGNSVWFSAYSGAAGTPNRIYRSTNKGLNWSVASITNATGTSGSNYVAFENEQRGVMVSLDGTTARTTDGGATWVNTVVTGAVMRFVVNLKGTSRYVAVGNTGASWISYDGGASWSTLTAAANTQTLYGVGEFNGMVWAVGNTGTILKWNGLPLPVEFTALGSSVSGNTVKIEWTTATEKNNRGFEVERKQKDGQFVTRGFITGAGTSLEVKNYTFNDEEVAAGSYIYRIKQLDFDGQYAYSDEIEVDVTTPEKYALGQNYPNPFNPSTTISYAVKFDGFVSLKVYDFTGREVASLVNAEMKAGSYDVQFDASGLSSGIYFYTLQSGSFKETKKLTLLK